MRAASVACPARAHAIVRHAIDRSARVLLLLFVLSGCGFESNRHKFSLACGAPESELTGGYTKKAKYGLWPLADHTLSGSEKNRDVSHRTAVPCILPSWYVRASVLLYYSLLPRATSMPEPNGFGVPLARGTPKPNSSTIRTRARRENAHASA